MDEEPQIKSPVLSLLFPPFEVEHYTDIFYEIINNKSE